MDYQEAIKELDILNEHCFDMIDKEDKESIWRKDCEALDVAISAMQELQEYKKLGTLEEVREAVERQRAKKPIYKHYENAGEPPYIKIVCPNGCRIQLHPVTDKHLAHEHDYCPKCGQYIDWSEEE